MLVPNPPNTHAKRGESDHDAKHVFDATILRRHSYLETWLERRSNRPYAPACINIRREHIHKHMNIPQQAVLNNHHMHMDIKMCIYASVHVHIYMHIPTWRPLGPIGCETSSGNSSNSRLLPRASSARLGPSLGARCVTVKKRPAALAPIAFVTPWSRRGLKAIECRHKKNSNSRNFGKRGA